ncbi:uncharacterized protein THITE_2086740 [Thermothielavioides terrestris NRRL 8126]|uniref:Uncharacterized protein n=1 Tax=Thermothielavioides terrestris (strain ATCC 38088 / NRRL 8126) TaxID=578455 RepID=G2R4L9_THETT|nr:uncharacterized protein THITE_2086740 [Thermothielavioides terrestris NRRL 8126]AEO65254.1 hypothetical protein THITE_2086740 [Thermothielavioides terrestris NRRL 8126]
MSHVFEDLAGAGDLTSSAEDQRWETLAVAMTTGNGVGCAEVANLDFEARVPVPFSVFPSSYRESETATQTTTHEEVEIKLPQHAGREGQHSSSFQAQAHLPPRGEGRFREEEVRITREEEEYRRPGIRDEYVERDDYRRPKSTYSETRIEVDTTHRAHNTAIDVAESEYRSRFQPNYRKEFSVTGSTVDGPGYNPTHKTSTHVDEYTVDGPRSRPVYKESVEVTGTTVDPPAPRSTYHEKVDIVEETVEVPRYPKAQPKKSKMGYYDEDGHYHSFRRGLHKLADRIAHPEAHERIEVDEVREVRRPRGSSEAPAAPNTVTIPCHHIRLGDILILQGRPCQVIRISTSAATGQHRYLGVDLFTKQLHEESSFVSNPAPSVVVQTMLGPVFKQYRVLDMQDGTIVAMTETGDVKQNLPVIDQSNLWGRLQKAFESGRGSVRVLVVSDHGREMAVDMKVVHGSRL